MAIAMNLKEVIYVLTSDREAPEPEQTKFFIRPLTFDERREVANRLLVTEVAALGPKNQSSLSTMRFMSGEQTALALRYGVTKIENFRDINGELVKYESTMDARHKEAVFGMLHPDWCKELAEEILKMSGLSKTDEKN